MLVTLSAAKGLARRTERSFAALRMTARTPLKSAQVFSPNVWKPTGPVALCRISCYDRGNGLCSSRVTLRCAQGDKKSQSCHPERSEGSAKIDSLRCLSQFCVKQGEEMKRIPSDQHERENALRRSSVRLRKSMGLTQRALGRLLGISEQAIGHWERGVRSPKLENLKRLLALCPRRHAFTPGREHEEAQQLWRAAGKPADFDAFWMQVQLAAPS